MLAFGSAAAAITPFFLEAGDSKTVQPPIDLAEGLLQKMLGELDTYQNIMDRAQVIEFLEKYDSLNIQVKALRTACPADASRVKKMWNTFFESNHKDTITLLRQVETQHELVLNACRSAQGAIMRERLQAQ